MKPFTFLSIKKSQNMKPVAFPSTQKFQNMIIPFAFASKMSAYNIKFGSDMIKVDLVDNPKVLAKKMSEFKKSLKRRVVGVGYVRGPNRHTTEYQWVILCHESYCLMIDLRENMHSLPKSLAKFLSDETICFVGVNNIANKLPKFTRKGKYTACKTVMDVNYLVARAQKNPNILSYGLEKLADDVFGCRIDRRDDVKSFDWGAKVFSPEEIKSATHDVYYSYFLGDKVLSTLERGC